MNAREDSNTGEVVRHISRPSLAAEAREAILDSIMNRRFEDGHLPPEKDLADMLGVSRTTVRSALQSLQDAGVIVRTRGRGTQIRPHARPSMLALHRLVGFDTLLAETGREPSVESSWQHIERPPPDVLERMEWTDDEDDGGGWYLVDKLFRADGAAAILIQHYFPRSYVKQEFQPASEFPDWFTFGERFGRERVDHAVVEIRADCAHDNVAERLEIAAGTPIIVLHEMHYAESNRCLGYSLIAVNQDYVTFHVLRNS